jgi:hypothetical protein
MSHNDPRSEALKKQDLISRDGYTPTPAGKVTFLLRAIESALQYVILAHGIVTPILHRLGLHTPLFRLPAHTGIITIDSLGLSPFRLVLLGMSIGSATKQNIWTSLLSSEPTPVVPAIEVGLFNAFFNSVNSYAFLLSATSASKGTDFPWPSLNG